MNRNSGLIDKHLNEKLFTLKFFCVTLSYICSCAIHSQQLRHVCTAMLYPWKCHRWDLDHEFNSSLVVRCIVLTWINLVQSCLNSIKNFFNIQFLLVQLNHVLFVKRGRHSTMIDTIISMLEECNLALSRQAFSLTYMKYHVKFFVEYGWFSFADIISCICIFVNYVTCELFPCDYLELNSMDHG
jgi:hypothetical protein